MTTAPTKSERTRERLVAAAATTLSRLGYAGTRLVDIADEAGMQAPTIYYYFESRELLVEEVMVTGLTKLREFVKAALDATPADATPIERLSVAIDAHLRQLLAEQSFAHALIRNVGQVPEELRARQLPEERKYAAMWRALIRAGQADGSLRADLAPDIVQNLLIGQLNWVTEWWTPRRGSIESIVETAQAMIAGGIATGA